MNLIKFDSINKTNTTLLLYTYVYAKCTLKY